jgi:hypothetical protein
MSIAESQYSKMSLRSLFLFLCLTSVTALSDLQRLDIRDVNTLIFYQNQSTISRRTDPIPQLECIGGTASHMSSFIIDRVECRKIDHEWQCHSNLNDNYRLISSKVSCEGYDHSKDWQIVVGSCGLQYLLDYTDIYYKKLPRLIQVDHTYIIVVGLIIVGCAGITSVLI